MNKACLFVLLSFMVVGTVYADYRKFEYEVTVTNLTKGQAFTPILAATHNSEYNLFNLGESASESLVAIAEGGNIAPLKAMLDEMPRQVSDTASTEGLLMPGQSSSFRLSTHRQRLMLSLVSMLIPTNDTFVALNAVRLPYRYSKVYFANAYDAGSEMNDEFCMNIPGPVCGGVGPSPDDEGEGFVHFSAGIHGEGELQASAHDWRGAVAKIEIKRVFH